MIALSLKNRNEFGALLLGGYEEDRLIYVGQTDIGLTGRKLPQVLSRMGSLVHPKCPLMEIPKVKAWSG